MDTNHTSSGSTSIRFLSFADDKEDAEKAAKLKEAAQRIEQAIERQKSVSELIDYRPPPEEGQIDPANDTRPLYERLLEQKNKKQEAFDESHKLSNLVTTLDEDEATYLNELAKSTREEEIRKRLEVHDILEERKRNSEQKIIEEERKLRESFLGKTFQPTKSTTNSLKSKLSSLIKVKPKAQTTSLDNMVTRNQKRAEEKAKNTEASSATNPNKRQSDISPESLKQEQPDLKRHKSIVETSHQESVKASSNVHENHECTCSQRHDVMRCIGILPSLPLLDKYPDSSDSDNSDDNLNSRIVPRIGQGAHKK